MAIAVVATQKAALPNGGAVPSFDSTGANCIVVFAAFANAPTVTDNFGNTYTAGVGTSQRFWYCLNATVGAGHVVTLTHASMAGSCVVYALSGVATTGAYASPGGTSVPSGTSVSFGVNETPADDGRIVIRGLNLSTTTITGAAGSNGWTVAQWSSGVGGSYNGSIVAHKIQTAATLIPAAETYATWTNTASGNQISINLKAAVELPPEGISITTPSAYEVHQRSGTTGSIQISGTVSGTTEDIEASFNGGAYVTIASAVAPGSFSGTLSAQAQGQGTLTVRKKTTTTTNATVAFVGIGDVFAVGGDSISEGRGTNAQTYTHATLKAAKFTQADAWGDGVDGIDTGTSAGSHWPLLATQIMADQGVPVAFISAGTGSTDVAGTNNQWAKPNGGYTGLTGQVSDSTVSGVKGVLMHLGPNAVVNGTTLSLATYNTALDTLASNLAADIVGAPKLNLGIFGEVSTGSPPDRRAALDNLRGAIIQALGDNANIKPGPCLIDLDYTDGVHPLSDVQLQAVAQRWWIALKETYYSGSGGRGPRLSAAMWNAGRDQLTVVFDRALKTGLTHATACWKVSDNGSAMTVSSIAYHGTNPNAIVLTMSAAAVGASGTTTLTFASGDDAVGLVVPRSSDIALAAGGTTTIPAEPIYAAAVSELDTTPPTLSSPTANATGATTASVSVSTNEANGTLYRLTDGSASALLSAVKATGVQTAVSATGAQPASLTGLTAATTYYTHWAHTDAAGNDSSVVTAGPFTTSSAPAPSPSPSGSARVALTQSGQLVVLLP